MTEKCTVCGKETEDLYRIAEQYLLDVIKAEHPDWVEENGACKKCVEYYHALDHAVLIE